MAPKYPWDEWLRRRRLRLVRGIDFDCQPHSMSVMIRTRAARRGLRVSVSIDESVITVRRLDRA